VILEILQALATAVCGAVRDASGVELVFNAAETDGRLSVHPAGRGTPG